MITTRIILLISLLLLPTCLYIQAEEPSDLSVAIINDVADITDDLATLIINCRHSKDPEVTKILIVSLLRNFAKLSPDMKKLIDAVRSRKQTRSLFDTDSAFEVLANQILQKASEQEDEL